MRTFILFLLLSIITPVVSVHAGAGHSHGPGITITEQQAIQRATEIVSIIVEKGKIDKSWAEVDVTQAEKQKNKYGQEWVVTFNNPNEADKSRQTLYVFLSLDGQYLGANFTGA